MEKFRKNLSVKNIFLFQPLDDIPELADKKSSMVADAELSFFMKKTNIISVF